MIYKDIDRQAQAISSKSQNIDDKVFHCVSRCLYVSVTTKKLTGRGEEEAK